MRYFVLKTGNIVSDEDIRNAHEIVFGELKILDDLELKEIMKMFSGIITELHNPTIEEMLRFGKENLAIKIYAQENNCNISVARKEIKNLDIEPMSSEELQNFISSYQVVDEINENLSEEIDDDIEDTFAPEEINLSTEKEKIEVVLNVEKVEKHQSPIEIENEDEDEDEYNIEDDYVEEDEDNHPTMLDDDETIEQITYNLEHSDITGDYKTDLGFDDEKDIDNGEIEKLETPFDEELTSELKKSEEVLEPIFKDTEIEEIKKPKKKKGFFKKLGSLLLFGSSDDDGYDDYDEEDLVIDEDDYYEED